MLNVSIPTEETLSPRIMICGVGGGGCNAVNNMIRSELHGVEFTVLNTDAQALQYNLAPNKIQIGSSLTKGLGAGARPDVGAAAAQEQMDEITSTLQGANMVFIAAGMGGGTGTGAAPVVARAARDLGILTVGVVTKPFHFEGAHRMRLAEKGIQELQQYVDTLIVIPNQNLFRLANEKTTFADAFKMADDVLHSGVRGVTDLITMPGLINLDFNDIRSVMSEMGKAMMGTGEATGASRAVDSAEAAIRNPLLDDVSMKGAKGVLINITGGADMTLFEVDAAANRVREEVDPDANIIFGSTYIPDMEGKMRVSVVATGIDAVAQTMPSGKSSSSAVQPQAAISTTTPQSSYNVISNTPWRGQPAVTPAPVAQPAPAAMPSQADLRAAYYQQQQRGGSTPASSAVMPTAIATGEVVTGSGAQTTSSPMQMSQMQMPTATVSADDAFMAPEPLATSAQPVPPSSFYTPETFGQQPQGMPQGMQQGMTASVPVMSTVETKRGPNLFERLGGGIFGNGKPSGQAPTNTAPAGYGQPAPQQPYQQAAPSVATPSTTTPQQPANVGMADEMEEELEIPAFLRRQSN